MIESLDNFARFSDFCAKNQRKKSTCDLFPCACGERPSLGEFQEYCEKHLRLDLTNPRHKRYMITLLDRLEECNWLTSKGKRPKSWKSLTEAHKVIIANKDPMHPVKLKSNTHDDPSEKPRERVATCHISQLKVISFNEQCNMDHKKQRPHQR